MSPRGCWGVAGRGQRGRIRTGQLLDTEGPAAAYHFAPAWGALTGNLEQLRQLRAQLLHGDVRDGAQDHHRPLEAGCRGRTDQLREPGGEGRARSTQPSSPAPRGACGPGTPPLLPGQRSPLAPTGGQPQGPGSLGGSGRWGHSPGAHLPSGSRARRAGSGPAL